MSTIFVLILAIQAQAQYLASEPAVAPLLEGIRFCAKEPMAGVTNFRGLQWLSEVKSGAQICTRNAAIVDDSGGTWLVYENSSRQLRALRISASDATVSEANCQQIQTGVSGAAFDIRSIARSVILQQKRLLLEAESAKPARTREDLLQFTFCHGSLNNLIREHGLSRLLSRSDNNRLTQVYRSPDVTPHGGGASR